MNDIFYCAATAAGVLVRLAVMACNRMVYLWYNWQTRKCVVWDATYMCTPLHHLTGTLLPIVQVLLQPELSHSKIRSTLICSMHGSWSLTFVKELGRKLGYQTREEKLATYLIEHQFVAVQHGNIGSMLGAWAVSVALEFSCLFIVSLFFVCVFLL